MFRRLLVELDYAARPTLARISFPGSHQASIVGLDGREYLVDVANGAPFFAPIPLDAETVLRRGGLAWRFHPDTDPEILIQDRELDGTWTPFCYYTLPAASAEDVELAYQRHHAPGESFVVGNLTVVRSTETEMFRLRDDELVRYSDSGVVTERVADKDLPAVAADVFDLPTLPISEAATALRAILAQPR
jgi:arylamine N-acetyltransferase